MCLLHPFKWVLQSNPERLLGLSPCSAALEHSVPCHVQSAPVKNLCPESPQPGPGCSSSAAVPFLGKPLFPNHVLYLVQAHHSFA